MNRNTSVKDVLAVVDGWPSSMTTVDQAVAHGRSRAVEFVVGGVMR